MPGDDPKTVAMHEVIESLSTRTKHLRSLSLYAGFDPEFSEAKWITKRESSSKVPHIASSLSDDSIPWVDEIDDLGEVDMEDFDTNDQDEMQDRISRYTKLDSIVQPIATMECGTWTEEPCQTVTYNVIANGTRTMAKCDTRYGGGAIIN